MAAVRAAATATPGDWRWRNRLRASRPPRPERGTGWPRATAASSLGVADQISSTTEVAPTARYVRGRVSSGRLPGCFVTQVIVAHVNCVQLVPKETNHRRLSVGGIRRRISVDLPCAPGRLAPVRRDPSVDREIR